VPEADVGMEKQKPRMRPNKLQSRLVLTVDQTPNGVFKMPNIYQAL